MTAPRRRLVPAASIIAIAATAFLAPGASAQTPPLNARIASVNGIATDIIVSLGVKPVAAVSSTFNPDAYIGFDSPGLDKYMKGVQDIGLNSPDLEKLAAIKPDGIVTIGPPFAPQQTLLPAIAPVYYSLPQLANVVPDAKAPSTWKRWLTSIADQLGRRKQAHDVITNVERRAKAIALHVRGTDLAIVRFVPGRLSVGYLGLPQVQTLTQELGIKPFTFPLTDYPCLHAATVTYNCAVGVSSERLPEITSPHMIAINGDISRAAWTDITRSPLFQALPAVKDKHYAVGPALQFVGPIGVTENFTKVEEAYGLTNLHTTLGGKIKTKADLVYDPAVKKLCWSFDSTGGKASVGAMRLQVGKRGAVGTTLSKRFAATGCTTLRGELAKRIAAKPGTLLIRLSTKHKNDTAAALTKGVAEIIATS